MYEIRATVVLNGKRRNIIAGVEAGNKIAALKLLYERVDGDLVNISIARSDCESGEFLMESV